MIVLINFNSYLGGGETLFVRLADFFRQQKIKCHLFYKENSFIEKDLRRRCITENSHSINLSTDYYYLSSKERKELRSAILNNLEENHKYEIFSFCARDLYLTIDLTKQKKYQLKLVHLILHEQDNLYCCQTITNKLKQKFGMKRSFSSKKMTKFNTRLFNEVNEKGVLIPMNEVIVKLWENFFSIHLKKDNVIPLPTCSFDNYNFKPINNKKILWIGRLIDFKIPSICAILNFLKVRPDYKLSIAGYGAEKFINNYIDKNAINKSQIQFLGKIEYDKLEEIVKGHAIGYAMGTSIIEMAQYGIPVIMAMASPSLKLFDKDICGGLYINKYLGNVGTDLYLSEDLSPYPTIESTISSIESRYEESAKECYEYIRKIFDFEINAKAYLKMAESKGEYTEFKITIPFANILRKMAFCIYNQKYND